jgi:hypothetical protein
MRMEYILLCRLKIYIICKVKRSTFFLFCLVVKKGLLLVQRIFEWGVGGGGGGEGKGNGPKWVDFKPKKKKVGNVIFRPKVLACRQHVAGVPKNSYFSL